MVSSFWFFRQSCCEPSRAGVCETMSSHFSELNVQECRRWAIGCCIFITFLKETAKLFPECPHPCMFPPAVMPFPRILASTWWWY